MGTAPAGFFIRKGDGFNAADQVRQGRVEQQVVNGLAVGGTDQLDAALGNRSGGRRFQFPPDLVDHDDFRVMVLDRLNHYLMLEHGLTHLHPSGLAHGRVRHIPIAADFIGSIHHNDALALGQDAGGFAQQGGLAHTRTSQDEQGPARLDNILDDIHRAINGAPDPASQTDDMAAPVAQAGDAVQSPLQTGSVIPIKFSDPLNHMIKFCSGDFLLNQDLLALDVARSRDTPQVEDDLEQVIVIIGFMDGFDNITGQNPQQGIQVVSYFQLSHA